MILFIVFVILFSYSKIARSIKKNFFKKCSKNASSSLFRTAYLLDPRYCGKSLSHTNVTAAIDFIIKDRL